MGEGREQKERTDWGRTRRKGVGWIKGTRGKRKRESKTEETGKGKWEKKIGKKKRKGRKRENGRGQRDKSRREWKRWESRERREYIGRGEIGGRGEGGSLK